MSHSEGPHASWQPIPISIAVGALIIALVAIIVVLRRPSPFQLSSATGATETRSSTSENSKQGTPPPAIPLRGAEAQARTVGRNLAGPLIAVRDALNAGKYLEAIAMLEAADATRKKSPYEQHVINRLLEYAYGRVRNYGAAAKVVEAELNDGFLTSSEIEKATIVAAVANYQLRNYDEAIKFGSRAIEAGNTDPEMHAIVGQAYYLKGDWNGAASFEAQFVNGQVSAGRTPDIHSLQLLLNACLKLADRNCEVHVLEKLVEYYPSPTYQRNLEQLQSSR